MAKATISQLETIARAYIDANKIAVDAPFVPSVDNIAGLLDKIGKIVTYDNPFIDKLDILDGEDLPFGKTIEEWYQDLVPAVNYDSTGANTLAPSDPGYEPVSYSYSLGRKVFKTTERYDNLERAVHSEDEYISLVTMITKRLYDSFTTWKYAAKRELLAKIYNACKKAANANVLCQKMDLPVDSTKGEAFIAQVKKDVELASDMNEGHTLNNSSIGASEGLVLFVKQGIMPDVEVNVLAGAFNKDEVAVPAQIKVIKDFGDAEGVFAILMDVRGAKLHNDYRATRNQLNGEGDFMNYFLHTENTAAYSKNTFVKCYTTEA